MGKSVYLTAAAITIAVFVSVFLFIKLDEETKFDSLSDEILALYEEQQMNKVFEAYLEGGDAQTCAIYERQIARQLSKVYGLFSRLEQLEEITFATSSERVKRQYLLTSMSLWIDLKKASEKCDVGIKPVLFFFPEMWKKEIPGSCIECDAMVEQLEVMKSGCSDIRVFAFPFETDEFEPVEFLKHDYGVSKAPAVVVKGNVFYSMVSTQELENLLGC